MNEKLIQLKNKTVQLWQERSSKQKTIMIALAVALIVVVSLAVFAAKPKLVPLYSNLSLQEAGQIQESLKAKGVQYELANNGTMIKVPSAMVDSLMVEFAKDGIPDTGNIDYSFFSKNASWGVTDKEFNVIKVDAMQTELANLIKQIEGVADAKVMLTVPDSSIWVSQNQSNASASVVITQKPGYKFEQNQINALYLLVSKSVPNLPTDNIVIMNQLFEPFVAKNSNNDQLNVSETFMNQNNIKKEVEAGIQRQVQQMLGTMIGLDKVVVSVTADLDFTKEKRTEERYEPYDKQKNQGLTRSVERITETYSGTGTPPGGVSGSGRTDIPTMAQVNGSNGDYKRLEERVNNELDKINKEIISSPYQVRNLGIQVVIDPTTGVQPGAKGATQPVMLTQAQQNTLRKDIEQMLGTVIRTSLPPNQTANNITLTDKISITMQPFNGRANLKLQSKGIPVWLYVTGGALILIIATLLFLLLRRRKKEQEDLVEENLGAEPLVPVPDINDEIETESMQRRKQLEKMAKEKPDEFAKLLKSWITEE